MTRSTTSARIGAMLVGLALLVLVLAACDDGIQLPTTGAPGTETPEETTPPETSPPETSPPETSPPETSPPETSPPETTPPETTPPTTQAPVDENEGIDTTAALVIVGLLILLIILLVALARSRRRRRETTLPTRPPAGAGTTRPWSGEARRVYGLSRWLHDNMTTGLALWRAESMAAAQPLQDPQAAAHEATWNALGERMAEATTDLYALEAAVPTPAKPVVTATVEALGEVRTAVDGLAGAHLAVLELEREGGDAARLEMARTTESQAVDHLVASRGILDGALRNLSNIT